MTSAVRSAAGRWSGVALSVLFFCGLAACAKPSAEDRPQDGNAYASGFRIDAPRKTLRVIDPRGGGSLDVGLSRAFRRLALSGTSQLGLAEEAGLLETVTAFAGGRYVSDPEALKRLADGRMIEAGDAEAHFQDEVLVQAKVDAALGEQGFAEAERTGRRLGLPVVPFRDAWESHPLGRAEWMRVLGALTGQEARADAAFHAVRTNYEALVRRRPSGPAAQVLVGLPWNGVWWVPGRRTWMAKLLEDAGASLVLSGEGRTGVAKSVEEVMAAAPRATFWLHPGTAASLRELARVDSRFGALPALAAGRVWNADARKGPGGGLDIHERAVARPDLVLEELRCIFEERTLPERALRWYRRLPP